MSYDRPEIKKQYAEKKYHYMLFDLDGTIVDSEEGITKSVQYALSKFGITENDLKKLRPFIGPPLVDSFEKYYGMSRADAEKAVAFYRERYSVCGMYEASVYDGLPQVLQSLYECGVVLIVASSKPETYVRRMLERAGILQYFTEVVGATMDGRISEKTEVLHEVLRRCGISEEKKAQMIMIGDRRYDIEGAISIDIDSVGTNYGFPETPDELEKAGATFVVETPQELGQLLKRTAI